MADLEAVYPRGRFGRLLAVLGAVGTVLAGVALITIGGAKLGTALLVDLGLPREGARQVAFASVGTVPPVVFAGALAVATSAGRNRLVGLAGVVAALVGIAVALPFGFDTVAPVVALVYGGGLFVAMSALVESLLGRGVDTDGRSNARERTATVDMFRSPDTENLPADGGGDDDDLTFLLDDEE